MDTNLIEGSTLQGPSAEEIRSLSRRMGFVIKDEEISVYLGKYFLFSLVLTINDFTVRTELTDRTVLAQGLNNSSARVF